MVTLHPGYVVAYLAQGNRASVGCRTRVPGLPIRYFAPKLRSPCLPWGGTVALRHGAAFQFRLPADTAIQKLKSPSPKGFRGEILLRPKNRGDFLLTRGMDSRILRIASTSGDTIPGINPISNRYKKAAPHPGGFFVAYSVAYFRDTRTAQARQSMFLVSKFRQSAPYFRTLARRFFVHFPKNPGPASAVMTA